jgi:hypothetical protein
LLDHRFNLKRFASAQNMFPLKSKGKGRTTPVEQLLTLNSKPPGSDFVSSKSTSQPAELNCTTKQGREPGGEERDEDHTGKEVDDVKCEDDKEPTIVEAREQPTSPPAPNDAKSHISDESTPPNNPNHLTQDNTYTEVILLETSPVQSKKKNPARALTPACCNIFGFDFASLKRWLRCKGSCSSVAISSMESKGILRRMVTESESFDEDEYYGLRSRPSHIRRGVREIYADIRDLQHDRLTAQPEMLVDIDLALEVLRDELRSARNATRAAYNNAQDEEDDISICDSISSIHQSISKIEKAANENAEAFLAIAEQNNTLVQSVQTMQQQLAMLTYPVQQGKGPGNDNATKAKKVVWKEKVKVKNTKKGKGPGDNKETKVKIAVDNMEDEENVSNHTKKGKGPGNDEATKVEIDVKKEEDDENAPKNLEKGKGLGNDKATKVETTVKKEEDKESATKNPEKGKGPGDDKATKVEKAVNEEGEENVSNHTKKGKGPGDDKTKKVDIAVKKEEDDENDTKDAKKDASASGCDEGNQVPVHSADVIELLA